MGRIVPQPSARRIVPRSLAILEPCADGVLFRRGSGQLDWVASFLIGLDMPVRVIRTPELRDKIRALGQRALAIAGDSP